jgi:hypothetical protein
MIVAREIGMVQNPPQLRFNARYRGNTQLQKKHSGHNYLKINPTHFQVPGSK